MTDTIPNQYCGYNLSDSQKMIGNELALNEFERPVNSRLTAVQLVLKVIKLV